MFGSDNIRVKISGYLKNITENECLEIDTKGIKSKNKIIFSWEDIKYNIRIEYDSIYLVREGNDFINSFVFNNKNSKSSYLLKENNYEFDIDINTSLIDINNDYINIKYEIIDTKNLYEFKILIGEIL